MKRKLLRQTGAILLSLILCLCLLPTGALAYDYPHPDLAALTIGKTEIEENTHYLINESGSITTDDASAENYNIFYTNNTLTLNNAVLTSGIYVPGGTTIKLLGRNVSGSETKKVSIGIQAFSGGSLTITGTGSYDVYTNYEGIATVYADSTDPVSKSDIIIESGTLNMHGAPIGTRYGGLTITGSANVTAGAISTGGDPNTEEAQRARDIIISGNAEVTAESISNSQTIKIEENAVVNVTNSKGDAISGSRGIEILENAKVTAYGKTGALNAFRGHITINSTRETTLTATTNQKAAISMGQGDSDEYYTLTINSDVDITGSVGIGSSQGPILIDGGTVNINASYIGIANQTSSTENAAVTIKNATMDIGTPLAGIMTSGQIAVEESTVTVRGSTYGIFSMPTLTFAMGYNVTAGDSESDATLIPNSSLTNGVFNSKYVKIEPVTEVTVDSVTLGQSNLSLTPGGTAKLTATVSPENATDKTVTWTSSDEKVAMVDENGTVTAIAPGTTVITAAAGGKTATCTVTVTYPTVPGYPPIIGETEHGTATATPQIPVQGQRVTITAKPDAGYEAGTVAVTDRNGNEIDVTDNGDGTYSFVQPGSRVTIAVTFRRIDCPQDGTCPMAGFTDLNMSAWYHDGVHYCLENGLMNGMGDGLFAPNGTTTRAQLVTILWRLEGEPGAAAAAFSDVAAGSYYESAVNWAAENGIVLGVSDTMFAPDDAITREQFAVILWRYAKHKGADVSAGEVTDILSYDDALEISEYAVSAMQWACGEGIINGTSGSTLDPKDAAARAQAAAMLQRFCENIA